MELTIEKSGFETQTVDFDGFDLVYSLIVTLEPKRSKVTVTTAQDLEPGPDGEITLREALNYASGRQSPVGTDRVLIDGPVGAGRADDIVLAFGESGPVPVISVKSTLPAMDDPGDRLIGPPGRVAIAPAFNVAVRGAGLTMGPETEIENVIFDGFDVGLSAEGFGTVSARDVSAWGGVIGFSASDGAELLLSGADAISTMANVSAHSDGLVDGLVNELVLDDFDNLTLHSGPSGENGQTIVEGWLPVHKDTNVFVHHAETRPLREVEGLDASTSSYHLYHIFGHGQSDQRWPRHVFDGIDGNYFQWEFKGPAEHETMSVFSQRPMRTDKFTLHHLQGKSHLVRYEFSLIGRSGRKLETYEIEADRKVDVIPVNPNLDFFGFRINVMEAVGGSPGFTEIEAEVTDTDAYIPISASRRRIVFPRPSRGLRGIVELRGTLLPIGVALFGEAQQVKFNQFDNISQLRPRHRIVLPSAASVENLNAALAELSASPAAEIVIPGTADFDASLAEIGHRDLKITGGGVLRSTDGTPLKIVKSRGFAIDDISLTGAGLDVRNSYPVSLNKVLIEEFDIAILADSSGFVITDSRIAGGKQAFRGNFTSLTMTGTVIEAVEIGISNRAAEPMILVGNKILARDHGVDIRPEGGYASVAHMIANHMEPPQPAQPVETVSYHSVSSLIGGNTPPVLGFGRDTFSVRNRPGWLGYGVADIRKGSGPTHVRIVAQLEPELRCLLIPDPSQLAAPAPIKLVSDTNVILHDAEATLICYSGNGAASIDLPLADSDRPDGGMPAAARLQISLGEGFDAPEVGIFNAIEAVVVVEPVGSGRAFPPLGNERTASSRSGLINSLVKSGDFAQAFSRAYNTFVTSAHDGAASSDLLYAARSWSDAMTEQGRIEEALELLYDLADIDRSPAGAEDLLINALALGGGRELETKRWGEARKMYRRALERSPDYDLATNNIVYAYQQEIAARFSPDTALETVEWIEDEISEHPKNADSLREIAGISLGNAVVGALNGGQLEKALSLAIVHYRWAPGDRTGNNLLVAFQNSSVKMLNEGHVEKVFDSLNALTSEFGNKLDLPAIATNVFNSYAQKAIDVGEFQQALSAAKALFATAPTDNSRDLLTYVFARNAETIETQDGTEAAIDSLIAAIAEYPDMPGLIDQVRRLGNNGGIAAYEAGKNQVAVAILEKALSVTGDNDNLLQNLRVIYINWAVGAANGKDFDTASKVAEAGLKRFPGDNKFTDVIDFVNRNR